MSKNKEITDGPYGLKRIGDIYFNSNGIFNLKGEKISPNLEERLLWYTSCQDVLEEVNEQKIIYRTCSRILDEFPNGSRHKAAKKLNETMDQSLKAIEELGKLYK